MNFEKAFGTVRHLKGWFWNEQQARVMWHVLQGGGHAIEIGTYCGKSAIFMALACQEAGLGGKVYCVDPFDASNPELDGNGTLDEFLVNIRNADVEGTIVYHVGRSTEACIMEAVPKGACLLYVDGMHEYEPVKLDIANWRGHVAKGGIMMFHDYWTDGSGQFPGVKQAVDEAVNSGKLHGKTVLKSDVVYFRRPTCACKGW